MGVAKYRKERQQFEAEITAMLLAVGAKPYQDQSPWPCFALETMAGELRLGIHSDLWHLDSEFFRPSKNDSPWVSSRFLDVERAKTLPLFEGQLNPYSGKWNHHYWGSYKESFFRGIEELRVRLINILPT